MEKTLHALVAVAFSATVLTGCQSPVSSGSRTAVSVAGDTIVAASLSVDNPSLARHIAMTGVRTRLLANGLLEVQAALESNDKRDYLIQYKFRWFDDAGMEIPNVGQEPWVVATVHGGEILNAIGVAPRQNIAGLTVSVRKAK